MHEMVRLSPSERAVLILRASGLSLKDVAACRFVSEQTVKVQQHQALIKLEARNITHAVVLAIGLGLITVDEVEAARRED